jgi:hypothetical protein
MKTEKECKEYLEKIQKQLDDMIDKEIGCINVSYLSKKEKEEVINKRNNLLIQKYMLNWVLGNIKKE